MDGIGQQRATPWVASLRRFVGAQPVAVERCEVCRAPIESSHAHLLELESRRLVCACDACALLSGNAQAGHLRRVAREASQLTDFQLSDDQWEAFLIPINMAFFFRSSIHHRVLAMYPGPAGTTESTLDLDAWDDLAESNPVLGTLQEDVEALLINRVGGAREYFRVPIDRCYELVGVIRTHWHGITGGQGSREAIQDFFTRLRRETGHVDSRGTGACAHA